MTSLSDRMKRYEAVSDLALTTRSPVVVRVDGKAFHSLTRGMDRPFDDGFSACMDAVAVGLCEHAQGAKLAYVQSDEVSVLLTDYDTLQTDGWFGYRVQKLVSVSASIATACFNAAYCDRFVNGRVGFFDARVFVLPRDEVTNYFIWRQRDAVRNSIQSTGQAHFSPREMHRKSTNEVQEMLFSERGINWNDTPSYFKRGRCAVRETYDVEGVERHRWVVDIETPEFTKARDYVEGRLP